jgi:cytoskeletal protein CcmA (bactofilin family)
MTSFSKNSPTALAEGKPGASVSVIARDTHLGGEIKGKGAVRIEGSVSGTVAIEAPLEVAERATVEAEVHASAVRVAGTVTGNITASELVELLGSAVVKGDITTPALHVVEGAKLEGRVQMKLERPSGKAVAGPEGNPQKAS